MHRKIDTAREEIAHLQELLDYVQSHVKDKRDLDGTPYAEQTLRAKIASLKVKLDLLERKPSD